MVDFLSHTKEMFRVNNEYVRCLFAEFLGMFVFLSFGLASVAQYVLYDTVYGQEHALSPLSINIGFAFGLTVAIIIAGRISGGHMNPAVSLMFVLIGAFVASALVYVTYLDALDAFDGGNRQVTGKNGTGVIWATYPGYSVATMSLFIDQLYATTLFLLVILAVTDPKCGKRSVEVQALVIGLGVLLIGQSYNSNCGGAVNPARDLIPRIFTAIAGWGLDVFRAGNNYYWIPVIAPLTASVIAAVLYSLFIRNHWPEDDVETSTTSDVVIKTRV